jgi:hypothetical protein
MTTVRLFLTFACVLQILSGLACGQPAKSITVSVSDEQSHDNRVEAEKLCGRLSEIKVLPFKGEHVDDPVYNGLKSLGKASIPCLVKQITNTTVTEDPRKAPKYKPVMVGDVAFWVLLNITGLPHDEMFPEGVKRRFKAEGMYAYFKYVSKYQNRLKLQQNVRRYLRDNAYY